MIIALPSKLNLMNTIKFCNDMWALEPAEEYIFDFQNLSFTEPFTMAYVSLELKRFSQLNKGKCSASNFEHLEYQSHMGFFRAFGLNHGKEPGEAPGSSTYLPITILNIKELKYEAYDEGYEVGELLEKKAEIISEILTKNDTSIELIETLTFSIREILRNVVEHSNSEIIEYCAQYWPAKSLVEVAIFDTGTGIKKGLSTNPFLEIKCERDALHMALLPSVSGKMYKGVAIQKNNPWQNSGYGLYMTNRICRKGSDFFIVSNDAGLLFNHKKTDLNCTYKGTALRLRINTKNLSSCNEMLATFREEGETKALELDKDGTVIKASIASTMLRKDFQD